MIGTNPRNLVTVMKILDRLFQADGDQQADADGGAMWMKKSFQVLAACGAGWTVEHRGEFLDWFSGGAVRRSWGSIPVPAESLQ